VKPHNQRDILWLSEDGVRELVGMNDIMPVVEEAFRSHGRGRVQMPRKVYLDFPCYKGDLRAMPAYLEDLEMAGVKIVNSHADNPQMGLPAVAALLVLNDPKTGLALAVLSATFLTSLRTGAAGGVAARYLARSNSSSVGLVGCGHQAAKQLEALELVFKLKKVKVWGLTRQESENFVRALSPVKDLQFDICDHVREACDADIVVTTTPSRKPLVMDSWIKPGTHINAIGADAPGKQELANDLIQRSKIIVDELDQACHAGEINVPISQKVISPQNIYAQLGEIIIGRKKGRETLEEITIFDSTGLAIQDVASGALVYQKAVQQKKGKVIESWLT